MPPRAGCAWFADLLPSDPGLVIDVGAGTGRNAAWLAGLGHEVVAIEPSAAFRALAQGLYPDARVTWLDDRLPSLGRLLRLCVAADAVVLSAVWQHVAPGDRPGRSASSHPCCGPVGCWR